MIREFEDREQKTKKLLKMSIFPILLMILLILAATRIQTIKVVGNTRYSETQVTSMIFSSPWDTNSCYQFIKERTQPHKTLPFVQKYEISWENPTSIEIIIYEKNVVGFVDYMSSYMYFDKDGIIVESTNKKLEGVPDITGLKFGSIVLYKELPVENKKVFNDILNLTGSLSSCGISCEEIKYDQFLNATLSIGDIKVLLGQDKDMEMKISTLRDILPNIQGLKGTLDLSEYSAQDDKERYIFKKDMLN